MLSQYWVTNPITPSSSRIFLDGSLFILDQNNTLSENVPTININQLFTMNVRSKCVGIFLHLFCFFYSVTASQSPRTGAPYRNYTCVKKCCPVDFIFDKTCVRLNNSLSIDIPIFEGRELVENITDISEISMANSKNMKRCDNIAIHKKFFIQSDGTLWVPIHWNVWHFDADEFCVEYDSSGRLVSYVCGDHEKPLYDILRSVGEFFCTGLGEINSMIVEFFFSCDGLIGWYYRLTRR